MTTEPTVPPGPLRTPQPERPTLATANHAPVVAHLPPPFSVRVSEFFWMLALAAGAVAVVYLFVVRAELVELLTERVRALAADRPDETLAAAADIVYWTAFGVLLAVVLLQVLFLVSFVNRRPRARWWMFATLLVLGLVLAFALEFTQPGTPLASLRMILLAQAGLGLFALLVGILPAAIGWTARGVDVRRGPSATDSGSDF